ncbi:MAG TPA: DUF1552 domain-containing protein, partial [Candidatus Solibacter sp.]|nr:DUF1552 domain-containing protein [Candidatus Solibacter sp.]
EHLTSVRDLERAISSLPPDYGKNLKEPEDITDLRDYPRIAKIQSDLLVHAFASGQTRVASYMLTKCQSLTRFPWLGLGGNRHHDYTHNNAGSPEQQRILRDITRWHVEEFAYLLHRMKSVPEGDGNLLDHTCCVYVHEHAEANPHKCNGLAILLNEDRYAHQVAQFHRRRLPDDCRRDSQDASLQGVPNGGREDARDCVSKSYQRSAISYLNRPRSRALRFELKADS